MAALTGEMVRGFVILLAFAGLLGWLIVYSVIKADDPPRMIFKWILTAGVVGVMVKFVAPMVGRGGYEGAFGGIPATAVCGLAFAAIWRHDLAGLAAKPFASLYDGGDEPPEARPAYSVAQARQKQGRYLEAITEIRTQLDRFPTDFEGQMLLAQIQAENLQDLPGAELTIQRLCAQPGHATKNITFALYSMADWHLAIGRDTDAARAALEQIIALFPDSESALGAAQRIAHLSRPEMVLDPHDRKTYAVSPGLHNVGLRRAEEQLKPEETDPGRLAAAYVAHLAEHPLDAEAREKLAVIYVRHYGRLDLAADQLEQLIAQPHQPAKQVARWLNLLADLQIRSGADYETVKQTLERIIERDPNLAAAEIARNRLGRLRLEFKANETKQPVKMGVYEQNLGLRGNGRAGVSPG
jgi:tetratricopeptide (TPR) repeat protein